MERFRKRQTSGATSGQSSKRSRSSGSTSVNAPASVSVGSPRFQSQSTRTSRPPVSTFSDRRRCPNCRGFHSGPCPEPRVCFHCHEPGHIRSKCPQLISGPKSSGGQSSRASTYGSVQQRTQPTRSQSTGVGRDVSQNTSRAPGRTQTRIYHMTQDKAHADPNVVTGIFLTVSVILNLVSMSMLCD